VSSTLGSLLDDVCRRHHGRAALRQGDRERAYGELRDRGGRLATWLASQGVPPGARVAVFLDDGLDTVDVIVGVALGGWTLVPVNARFRAGEIDHVLRDSGAAALIYSDSLGSELVAVTARDDLLVVVGVGGTDAWPGAVDLDAALAGAAPLAAAVPTDPEADAVIGYTSGTTGFPKGARCSHRAVVACTKLVPQVQGMVTYGAGVFIGSFSFVSALWGILTPHLWTGSTLRLADPADLDGWVEHLVADRATYTWVASPLVRPFTAALAARPEALTHLRTIVHTGSKVAPELLDALVDVAGDRLVETWGLTESVGPLTATTRADFHGACAADRLLASVGRPVPTAEVAVLDPDGRVTREPGVAGELVARGDTLFSGYLGTSTAPSDTYVDGWFRTGDVGRFDDAGYVYIEDRVKDMIVSGGMNVYAAEVELAISLLPGVVECAVFGVPDDRWGEAVAAAVVAAPGAGIDEHTVIAHVRTRLASYKKPTSVVFVDALPRNASMKVQKHLLRARRG
jgi:acyl-CoA synthetase (AMP-forming)/AMP-acid ligase II